MQRLLDDDPSELRMKYLFDFAHICHMSPSEVDALRYVDFIQLIVNIDAFREAEKKMWEVG